MILLCLLSGGLLILCFPPYHQGWLAWLALVPWLWAVTGGRRVWVILGAWLSGVVFFAGLMSWLRLFGPGVWGYVLICVLAVAEGLAFALAALAIRLAHPRGAWGTMIAAGCAWVTFEWLRSLGAFGVSWGMLGLSQAPYPSVVRWASWFGVPGISFAIVVFNAAVVAALPGAGYRGRNRLRVAVIAALLLVAAAGKWWPARHAPAPALPAALIQGNVLKHLTVESLNKPWTPTQQERDLATYERLTRRAAARRPRPRLIIWPESAVPAYLPEDERTLARIQALAREAQAHLLVGAPHSGRADEALNSVYLFSPAGEMVGRYDKVRLVPFAEYVPGRKWVPLLRFFTIREQDVTAGEDYVILPVGDARVAPVICFESIFAGISRRLVNDGAQVLVVMTNDAWFLRTAAPAQHADQAKFRAVETGAWLLRCASTGISAVVSPRGEFVEEAGLYREAILTAPVSLAPRPTLYRRWGYWFPWAAAAVLGLMILWASPARQSRVRPARSGPTAPR